MWISAEDLSDSLDTNTWSLDQASTYALVLHIHDDVQAAVGRLGQHHFRRGFYVYVGSARRGLVRRLQRHMAKDKVRRWHIDFLTTLPVSEPLGAFVDSREDECGLNRLIGALPGASVPIKGFGASDCSRGCPAHLHYFKDAPVETLKSHLRS